jgi:hypothetical protein
VFADQEKLASSCSTLKDVNVGIEAHPAGLLTASYEMLSLSNTSRFRVNETGHGEHPMVGLSKIAYAGFFLSLSIAFEPAAAQSDPTSLQPGRSRIETIEITKRISPAFGGRSFGTVGQYELLVGRAHGLADPRSVRNAGVVDIDRAPTNAEGLVGYSFDMMILKPIDLAKTNGTLVFEVSNRGRPLLHTSLLDGDGDFDKTSGAGSTFILQQGYMLAWTGWQADLGGSEAGALAADYPVATDGGRSITGWVRDEITIDGSSGAQVAAIPANASSVEAPLYYPLAQPDRPQLKVSVRERADDTPQQLPPDQIAVTGPKSVQIKLAEGFDRGALYSVEYEAKDPRCSASRSYRHATSSRFFALAARAERQIRWLWLAARRSRERSRSASRKAAAIREICCTRISILTKRAAGCSTA